MRAVEPGAAHLCRVRQRREPGVGERSQERLGARDRRLLVIVPFGSDRIGVRFEERTHTDAERFEISIR